MVKRVAESLLPFLFQKAEYNTVMRKCRLGLPYLVNFILQMPSGRAYHFTGRPDFTINGNFTSSVVWFTMKGIEEVQSPPSPRRRE